jgi:protein-S-isoprenylcysteine O-methyltransferase Ste14
MLVVPALDHRFGWSVVPVPLVIAGDVLILLGFLIIFFVYKENTFASATIELSPDQKVISTGLYSIIRHPMYFGGLLLFIGISFSLGSWWGLVVFALMVPALIWRLLDEEKFLARNLPGYTEYQNKVRYHLIPYVW